MKTLLLILVLSCAAFGQAKKPAVPASYLELVITKDNIPTSELTPMPIGMSSRLTDAKISAKYFGPESDSNISILLILKGTKNRYSTGETFGVKFLVDDVPLSAHKYRIVDSVDKKPGEETLHLYISTENLAWLSTAKKLKLEIYKTDTEAKEDTLMFTSAGLQEFQKFAKSVYLIKSAYQ